MGNYKFTFEDGSEALAHYGKKGMHWGEWNEETRRKYEADPESKPSLERDGNGNIISRQTFEVHNSDGTVAPWTNNHTMERDPRTGNYYDTKSLGAGISRGLDNLKSDIEDLIRDPGYKLSSVASKTVQEGKKLLDGILNRVDEEAHFLVEGNKPEARIGSTQAKKLEAEGKPYTKVYGYNYHYDKPANDTKTFNETLKYEKEQNRQTDERVNKRNREQTSRYKNSTAKKLRNLVGLE